MSQSPWWPPHIHADRRPALLARGRIKTALRFWFEAEGFTEVECGALAVSPGNEAHLHAFATDMVGTDGARRTLYLHTSPEFAAKKLLAAGETRIFDFARVFRNRERGATHAPEFTMLEWYRANQDYRAVIADALAIVAKAAEVTGAASFSYRDKSCDPHAPAQFLTVADAFLHLAGIDLLKTLSEDGQGDTAKLAYAAKRGGITIAADDNWADIFSKILAARIEPRLGIGQPTILYEYPRCEAALAAPRRTIRASPSASSSMSAASSWPTASASSPIRSSNANALKRRWMRKNASTASAIRSTRISSPRWRTCRPPLVSRWVSTGW